jgi:autotransporter-associated beta strand protein
MNSPRHPLSALLLCGLLLLIPNAHAHAGSATWNLNPTSGSWNTAANWTPAAVPNGPLDTATFGVSNTPAISLSASVEVNGIVYNSGASAFTISPNLGFGLTISGAGITNNSATAQSFTTAASASGAFSFVLFLNSASAGDLNTFTNPGALSFADSSSAGSSTFINKGGTLANLNGGVTFFDESSTASNATFFNEAGAVSMGNGGFIFFNDSASAGNGTFAVESGNVAGAVGGGIDFFNTSSADGGVFNFHGGEVNESGQSQLSMQDSSSAGHGLFNIEGGSVSGALGAFAQFSGSATADSATFIINGGMVAGAGGGRLSFASGGPTAALATLIANGGFSGAEGGGIFFYDGFRPAPTGGSARVELFSNGYLDISERVITRKLRIGSLEGDGLVFLGQATLGIGNRNLDTEFSGLLQDGGAFGGSGGSLIKTGTGKLTLSGANTYTGGTIVNAGTLIVSNKTGSGTGTGTVQVQAGTLGGTGKISGVITVASGTKAAILAPGSGNKPGTLTTLSALTFNSHATYKIDLNSSTVKADKGVANGVTINSGALVSLGDLGSGTLTTGTVFTVISNTAATPIAGTFSNLADNSTVTVGNNTYKVSYEGGTGNDLTLTVQ